MPCFFGILLGACGVLRAQSFDLSTGRLPTASLDGLWRFHTGDNPAWADPNFDDSKWPLLRTDEDWASQGYKGYTGIAWYRFTVSVPAGIDDVSLLLPWLRGSCHEVFADGRLSLTHGKLPPSSMKCERGPSYQLVSLATVKPAGRSVEIALRLNSVWGAAPSNGGSVGASAKIKRLERYKWTESFWRFVADGALALLQTLAGIGALILFALRRKEKEYLWFGLICVRREQGEV